MSNHIFQEQLAKSRPHAYTVLEEPMNLADIHSRSLATSTAISAYYYPKLITPLEVIGVLNAAKVQFMLIGTHAIGGWMDDPRCTEDVDLLIAFRYHGKAVRVLRAAYPSLRSERIGTVTRLRHPDTGKIEIDVFPSDRRHFRLDLEYAHAVRAIGGLVFLIPSLEMAVAMKFASMTSPTRELADQYQDAHDFLCMIKANPTIDLGKLARVGKWIPHGGAQDLVERVQRVLAGERFRL